ncbi:septation protein SepH [Lipingzhangella sp. LS1_29]|uniref:Septation protein SepH n=1 Tax=Lipingzhangella rawalii TaxID=2055835 RepID=A0ABU2H0I0_9ACTN|nr:septation protein SepH [Lipingzhangella rawalii]MDS1268818.1 septation protein SepH [Lipingzhangella rawalii]
MQELRLVAVSEDGTHLVLASADRGSRFALPVDDRLRAAVRGQFSRLGPYEIEVENPLRPKEIQARIRSGETAESISEVSGIAIERVRWFEGPVLQEREYMAQQAQRATVRSSAEATPGPPLADLVTARIGPGHVDAGDAVWDSWKLADATWRVQLSFSIDGQERNAHWTYDPRRRSVTPDDEEAQRFITGADTASGSGPRTPDPRANVTPLPARRGATPSGKEAPRQPAEPTAGPSGTDGHPPEVAHTAAPEPQEHRPAPTASAEPPRPTESPAPAESEDRPVPGSVPSSRPSPPFPADSPSILTPPTPPAPGRTTAAEDPPAAEPPATQPPATETGPTRRRPAAASAGIGTNPPSREEETGSSDGETATSPAKPAHRAKSRGRGRRASVPSWDEIMFGSKKQD